MLEMGEMKTRLRQEYIDIRKNIPDKKSKSDIIFRKLIQSEEYKTAKTIALYKNLITEVETDKIIEHCLKEGKILVLPRVLDNDMRFYKINSLNDNFEKSKLGVYEPIDDKSNLIDSNDIDLIIVPGVCFDTFKNRLGFGKGFYDRFLNSVKSRSIAICFEEQIYKNGEIPTTNNDVRVDKIITDKTIYE